MQIWIFWFDFTQETICMCWDLLKKYESFISSNWEQMIHLFTDWDQQKQKTYGLLISFFFLSSVKLDRNKFRNNTKSFRLSSKTVRKEEKLRKKWLVIDKAISDWGAFVIEFIVFWSSLVQLPLLSSTYVQIAHR